MNAGNPRRPGRQSSSQAHVYARFPTAHTQYVTLDEQVNICVVRFLEPEGQHHRIHPELSLPDVVFPKCITPGEDAAADGFGKHLLCHDKQCRSFDIKYIIGLTWR